MKRFSRIVGKKDFSKFEKKGELYGLEAKCRDGLKVVYQDTKGNLFNLEGFLLSDSLLEGKVFRDGSRLLIKGWVNVIQVRDFYQLYPIDGSFGFCYGSNASSLEYHRQICDQEKLNNHKEIKTSYLVDDDKNVIYEVKQYFFDENPVSFDLFRGKKPTVLFRGKEEFGFVDRGQFVPRDPRGSTIVHPITKWLIDQN